MRRVAGLLAASIVSGCGGGGSDAPAPVAAGASAPGGLYLGYYQEDPATNPEDPMPGAFSLNLPTADGSFSGSMYFTYVGCQTSNVGTVGGTKSGLSLDGTWSGLVDNSAQSGSYSGSFDTSTQAYSGTYLNAGGKQFRDLRPCIQYTIAPNGTWEMFPVENQVPANFTVGVSGRTVTWPVAAGAAFTLVYVLDPVIARSSGNPVVWQTVFGSNTTVDIPATVTLQTGKEYIAAVGIADAQHLRKAFGSKRFTP